MLRLNSDILINKVDYGLLSLQVNSLDTVQTLSDRLEDVAKSCTKLDKQIKVNIEICYENYSISNQLTIGDLFY